MYEQFIKLQKDLRIITNTLHLLVITISILLKYLIKYIIEELIIKKNCSHDLKQMLLRLL